MYFEENIWSKIKTYIFHDIKIHGKHLDNDEYVRIYNNVVNQMKRSFINIYYVIVHYGKINILKEIDVYEFSIGKYIVATSYRILHK
mgnify:CR=1 FL=1|tara:strand:+ start:2230 stop:2490 length:261 start_codon:yes stop_codon:yes gene_type:complete